MASLETILSVELHRGKLAKAPVIRGVRPLVREDLLRLRETRVQPRTKVLRDTHHRLARLIASGLRDSEVLRITGYSSTRLAQLKTDPAFQQLIAEYRVKATEAWVDSLDELAETATENMLRMERQVQEHLDQADEKGELIPLKTLFVGIGDRMDRFGYPKKKIAENINHDYAKRLEQMMVIEGKGTVIGTRAAPSPSLAPPPQEDHPHVTPEGEQPAVASAGVLRRF